MVLMKTCDENLDKSNPCYMPLPIKCLALSAASSERRKPATLGLRVVGLRNVKLYENVEKLLTG